jgi:hypothetical protein
MDNKLNYQQARAIRKQSLKDVIADELIRGDSVGQALKGAIGLKFQAKMKGIKEKFDPLNIVKFLTFGSRLGPALYGRLFGRSRKDIEYFTGRARAVGERRKKIAGLPTSGGEDTSGMSVVLNQILTFLKKSHEDDMILREKENNLREGQKLDDDRRHTQLLKALGVQKPTGSVVKIKEKGGFLDGIMDFIKNIVKGLQEQITGFIEDLKTLKNLFKGIEWVSGLKSLLRFAGPLGLAALAAALVYEGYLTIEQDKAKKLELAKKGDVEGLRKSIQGTMSDEEAMATGGDTDAGVKDYLQKAAAAGSPQAKEALNKINQQEEGNRPKTEKRFFDEYMNSKKFYDMTGNKNYKNMLTGERPDKATYDAAQAYADTKMKENGLLKGGNQVPGQRNATNDTRRLDQGGLRNESMDARRFDLPEPVIETPKTDQLNNVIKENTSLNLPDNRVETAVNDASNNKIINNKSKGEFKKYPIPPVRNLEESFQRMIMNSTRLV